MVNSSAFWGRRGADLARFAQPAGLFAQRRDRDKVGWTAYALRQRDDAVLGRVLELRHTYADLRLGFVDAAVFAIVERLGEAKLATLDRRHFAVLRPRHVAALELLPAQR